MKYNFHDFTVILRTVIEFRVEWDNNQWNEQYINFKTWLDNLNQDYINGRGAFFLYAEFAKEFYQDAKPDTHDYWII